MSPPNRIAAKDSVSFATVPKTKYRLLILCVFTISGEISHEWSGIAGLAGKEFLPLPRSKGAAFASCSLSTGSPPACANVAHGQDALPKVRKLRIIREDLKKWKKRVEGTQGFLRISFERARLNGMPLRGSEPEGALWRAIGVELKNRQKGALNRRVRPFRTFSPRFPSSSDWNGIAFDWPEPNNSRFALSPTDGSSIPFQPIGRPCPQRGLFTRGHHEILTY
jgi:hypothetical protein